MKIADWTNGHAAALRHFLEQKTGQDFLGSLRMKLQPMGAKTFEETALNARFREGQESILEAIDELRNWDEKPEVNYNNSVNTNDGPR